MNYSTDEFFDFLYHRSLEKKHADRSSLRKVLKLDELEEMSGDITFSPVSHEGNIYRCDMTFLPHLTAPVWVIKPQNPNGKAVLYCHGHGKYGAKASFTDYGEENPYHHYFPLELAKHGYTVFVPEFVGFGKMVYNGYKQEDQRGCYSNSALLLMNGLNIAGVRVFEAISVLKAMRTEGFSLPAVFGTSGGGLAAAFLGAVCDMPSAVIVSNYGAVYKGCIMAMHHCIDNYIPDMLSIGESYDILSLNAPKPLMLTSGKNDRIFPSEFAIKAAQKTAQSYEKAGLGDKFVFELHEGVHEISFKEVFGFLEKFC